jgi:hypothetical protein
LGVIGQEEIIIVKNEDFDFPLVIQIRHLIGNVLGGPQPEALAGLGLLMPGGNATESTIRIAPPAIDACISNVLFETQKKGAVAEEGAQQRFVPLQSAG